MNKDDTLNLGNVEQFAAQAVQKYFELNRTIDAMIWKEILRLLAEKYNIPIEKFRVEKK